MNSYVLVKAPEDYPGKLYRKEYILEHHLVWWQNTGEVIDTSIYIVHHKDENKSNNLFSNLEKIIRGDRTNLHRPIRAMHKSCGAKHQHSKTNNGE